MSENLKVSLRNPEKEDLPVLWELIYGEEEPEFKKWDAPYFPLEKVSYERWSAGMKKQLENGADHQKLIIADDAVIGTVTYFWEHERSNWMEIGIVIFNPAYWNGGYGSTAFRLWVDDLFARFPAIPRLGYTTWSGNERMIRVGEKLGFQEEARIRKCRLHEGRYYDSVKMGILREEWESTH
ncbi:GNAT family N-acetyltransferase [Alteribacter natronophilus]|nr:GNAT family N-acetyltransferase [Alteribacter natronophilus]